MKKSFGQRLLKFAASLKLAVSIMIGLAALIAWGTIIESRYDAIAAKKLVYDTPLMLGLMALLSTSLIAVMVDRWPWKLKHTPFLMAHVGILILMFGSILTMKFGLDGTMAIPIGQQSGSVVLAAETDLLVYASFGGSNMTKLEERAVDFFRSPPTEQNPIVIPTDSDPIRLTDYRRYVLPRKEVVVAKEATSFPGVRFQIQNPNVSVVEWLVQPSAGRVATHDFGPAKIHLGPRPDEGSGGNEIYLTPEGESLRWTIFRKDSKKPSATGVIKESEVVQTGWMGLELRILRYLPRARQEWSFEEREAPTPLTTSAVKVRFKDREQWLLLDDTLRLFTDDTAYLVSYLHRRIDLGFKLHLKEFEMIPYQGTQRAKEYRSRVVLPELGETMISMNEPAKYNGLTFYQASFQNDEAGNPIASVLSVNNDPGRVWKYLGSLIICLGIVFMFWFRRRRAPVKES